MIEFQHLHRVFILAGADVPELGPQVDAFDRSSLLDLVRVLRVHRRKRPAVAARDEDHPIVIARVDARVADDLIGPEHAGLVVAERLTVRTKRATERIPRDRHPPFAENEHVRARLPPHPLELLIERLVEDGVADGPHLVRVGVVRLRLAPERRARAAHHRDKLPDDGAEEVRADLDVLALAAREADELRPATDANLRIKPVHQASRTTPQIAPSVALRGALEAGAPLRDLARDLIARLLRPIAAHYRLRIDRADIASASDCCVLSTF